jgi:class 3 adenylate cyclase
MKPYIRSQIDLKYTEQHYSAKILKAYIDYLTEFHGEEFTRKMFYEAGIDLAYAKNENNWVSEAFFDTFYQLLDAQERLPRDWAYQIQKYSNNPKHFTIFHATLSFILTPKRLYHLIAGITSRFNKVDSFELKQVGKSQFVGTFKSRRETPFIRHIVDGWLGYLETVPCIIGELPATVEVVEEGGRFIYSIQLQQRQRRPWLFALTFLHAVLFMVLGVLSFRENFSMGSHITPWFYLVVVTFLTNVLLYVRKLIQLHNDALTGLRTNIEDYERRYMELFESKKKIALKNIHTQVLRKISTFALKTHKLTHLVDFTLKQTLSNLNFSRALVMLISEDGNTLEVSGLRGFEKKLHKNILNSLALDMKSPKRDPLLFHNLIYQKTPVVIHDVVKYKEKLLETNKEIVELLGVEQFIVSPLFDGGNKYGLLVLDREKKKGMLTEDDLRTSQGISNQLSISISHFYTQERLSRTRDNLKDSLETTRKIAQFVPKQLVRSIQSTSFDELYVTYEFSTSTVAFIDIAGYSTLAELLSPLETVEFLNQIFLMMDPIVEKYEGDIDKRIGDCAMVVFPMSKHHDWEKRSSWRAMQCLWEIKRVLENFSFKGRDTSIRKIEFHIGAATGPLIHANIGSPLRLEHTVLGDTVNVASRLEHLSKNNDILINEVMLQEIQDYVKAKKLKDVILRNKSLKVNVYEVEEVSMPLIDYIPAQNALALEASLKSLKTAS